MLKNEIIKFSSFIFNIISQLLKNISFLVMIGVGPKDMGTPAHLISSPRPTPRRKKCPRTNEGNPDRQIVLPRMTLSSAGQNDGREERHVARDNPLEDRKRDSKPYGLAIGEWWRDNPRRRRHFHIKYPQLTP